MDLFILIVIGILLVSALITYFVAKASVKVSPKPSRPPYITFYSEKNSCLPDPTCFQATDDCFVSRADCLASLPHLYTIDQGECVETNACPSERLCFDDPKECSVILNTFQCVDQQCVPSVLRGQNIYTTQELCEADCEAQTFYTQDPDHTDQCIAVNSCKGKCYPTPESCTSHLPTYYFASDDGSDCVQGFGCPKGEECFEDLQECKDSLTSVAVCLGNQCIKATKCLPNTPCFPTLEDCKTSGICKPFYSCSNQCQPSDNCSGDLCFSSQEECNQQCSRTPDVYYCKGQEEKCVHDSSCPLDAYKCFSNAQDCAKECEAPTQVLYYCNGTECVSTTQGCPQSATCYPDEKDCQCSTTPTQVYYCDPAQQKCTGVDQCPTGTTCFPTQEACSCPSPSSDLVSMVWSGGGKLASRQGLTPFQSSPATLVALASYPPEPADQMILDPAEVGGDVLKTIWNHITDVVPTSSDPRKYLLSIGGSTVNLNQWLAFTSSDPDKLFDIFSRLYTNHNIYGIDWDLEGLTGITQQQLVIFVNYILALGARLKQTFGDYVITLTLFASYTHNDWITWLAEDINNYPRVYNVVDYIVLMLYGETMYTMCNTGESGGVSWCGYVAYGSSKESCTLPNYFPAGSKTVMDMFHSSGLPLILGVTLHGQFACNQECLEQVKAFALDPSNNIKGIAVWCYGAYAVECQVTDNTPYNLKKLAIIDQIAESFRDTQKPLPTNEQINSALVSPANWAHLDGCGCKTDNAPC